jgi:TatA/E family protein of Tat protein translocase
MVLPAPSVAILERAAPPAERRRWSRPEEYDRRTMFGSLGFQEILLILVLALLIFGPRKLPEIGRTLGKSLAEFKKATNELKRSIENEVQAEEIKASLEGPKDPK